MKPNSTDAAFSEKKCLFKCIVDTSTYMTEDTIIAGCINKSPLAQRELYSRYSPKMMAICYRFAHSREDAEDILQEAFVKVFKNIDTYENKGPFEGWLRRIIVHTCINVLKRNKKFKDHVEYEEVDEGMLKMKESVYSLMQSRQIVECIRLMPIGYRTVLNLYAIEGYSHREIGEILDIEESTSRSQYTRAKVLLEQIMMKKRVIENPEEKFGLTAAF